jgi:hypothetical protein
MRSSDIYVQVLGFRNVLFYSSAAKILYKYGQLASARYEVVSYGQHINIYWVSVIIKKLSRIQLNAPEFDLAYFKADQLGFRQCPPFVELLETNMMRIIQKNNRDVFKRSRQESARPSRVLCLITLSIYLLVLLSDADGACPASGSLYPQTTRSQISS